MKWLVAIVFVEAAVEIFMHSEFFAWLRRIGRPFDCPWCLSVWIGWLAFGLIVIDLWWLMLPFAVARGANIIHEVYSTLRG